MDHNSSSRWEYLQSLEVKKLEAEQKVEQLRHEIAALERMIVAEKAKAYGVQTGERVNRKNVDRLFFEGLIFEVLKSKPKGLAPSSISREIEKKGHPIKDVTLRSYLLRMKRAGAIKTYNDRYFSKDQRLPNE